MVWIVREHMYSEFHISSTRFGSRQDGNGEEHKLRPGNRIPTTNNGPEGSEDEGTSDSLVRDNKKSKKPGGSNRALQNANDGAVGLDRLMVRSVKEWLELETEDLRCACLGVGLGQL